MFDRVGRRKYLNSNERWAFWRAVEAETDLHRKTFCLTLFYTGCRISEALQLTAQRVDLSGGAVVFETLKQRRRGTFRSVPIPDELVTMLRGIIPKGRGRRLWRFSRATGFRLVKEYMEKAGISGAMACPKGLRHGFAVACIGQKIPLTTMQKWLGHGRLETTAIYLNVGGEEERELARRVWVADSACQHNGAA